MADKQSRFPELNAALRHILILYQNVSTVYAQEPFDKMSFPNPNLYSHTKLNLYPCHN